MSTGEPITGGIDRPETALGVDPRIAQLGARFWPKVRLTGPATAPSTCWRYVGEQAPDAQAATRRDAGALVAPSFSIRGRPVLAARVAYELAGYGSTEGLALVNECGDEACCRPTHFARRAYRSGTKGRSVLDHVLRDGPATDVVEAPPAAPPPRAAPRPKPAPPPAPAPAPAPSYGHATSLLARRAAATRPAGEVSDDELRAALADPSCLTTLFGTKEVVAGEVRGQGWIVGVPWGVYRGPEPCALLREALAAMPHRPTLAPVRAA